jgi:vitamin B12 transporter
MRRSVLAVLLGAFAALPLAAQRPGEIAGRVVEAGTALPLEMAAVEIPELGVRGWTDASGRFRFAAVETGRWRLRVTRAGYAGGSAEVEVRGAGEAWVEVALAPAALALETVRVVAEGEPGTTTLLRPEIERSGARTAAELIEHLPGVVVRGTSPGGARTVSIRGSAPDAVLVLVDGIPLNDPVSGEADLSSVPAASVEELSVLPGARSARYGARAQAGVVLIRTRGGAVRRTAALSTGTLGERAGEGEWGAAGPAGTLQVGARMRALDGVFTHPRDPNDPRPVRRDNADLAEASAFATAAGEVVGGDLRLRAGWEALERGLPGTGHTPSPHARQEMERGRGSLGWRRGGSGGGVAALFGGTVQRVRYADPAPPFGRAAYDDTARIGQGTARVEVDRLPAMGVVRGWGMGAEGGVQRVEAGALSAAAPRVRRDAGLFAHLVAGAPVGRGDLALSAEGRVDRDGIAGTPFVSRSLRATLALGGARLHLANRSAYAPPTLGDQFFRAGVGIRPNPDLAPQRVPNEWEAGASWSGAAGGLPLSAELSAYRGDVRGMILWLPDFRFLWSPRNVDALRSGLDARMEARLPAAGVRVSGAYALQRVSYADAPGVQLAYRPRHTGAAGVAWEGGPWRLDAAARYTGTRYPAAAAVNALPAFWSTSLRGARDWHLRRWTLATALDVERLFDERDSLIVGFPEPGRRVRLDVRVKRTALQSNER